MGRRKLPEKTKEEIKERNHRYYINRKDKFQVWYNEYKLRPEVIERLKSEEDRKKRKENLKKFLEKHPNYYKEWREKAKLKQEQVQ